MKKINILRILFIIILSTITFFALTNPKKVETNLLKAFFSNGAQDEILVELSGKYSSNINVLFESENLELLEKAEEHFEEQIDKKGFIVEKNDTVKTLEFYKKYKDNLLSYSDYKLLKNGDFDKIYENAVNNLYNPFGFYLLPVEEDPFMLFTDFVSALGGTGISSTINGKYYEIINMKVDDNLALSPSLMNKEVAKLVELQKMYNTKDLNVYLTGAPVHAYYASESSMNEINWICIISTIFVGGLILWYFRSLKILIPVLLSLALGMGMGFCVTSLLFSSIHILTFVFSTTLIGICVDYSFHYLMECNLKKIIKSLTVSMISTVFALLILSFSGIELLKQIAVFTSAGLVTVYLFVILFYQLLPSQTSKHIFNLKFDKRILIVIFLIIAAGAFKIKFNDDIRTMYKPSKAMLNAEKLYQTVTNKNSNTSFIIVEGESLEKILQKEEQIGQKLSNNNVNYYSLSRFVPSIKRQKESQDLVKLLYNKKLSDFGDFLTKNDIEKLKEIPPAVIGENSFQNLPQLKEFVVDKNHSLMVVYDMQNPEIISDIRDVRYINLPLEISNGIKNVRIAVLKILLPIYFILYLILGFIFTFRNAHKIILPSVLASLFAISAVSLFEPLNLFHILAVFLITGFGLDYSVFRFNGSKNSNDAVFISCITTVFSFSLLALTSFRLISSLGFVLAVGLLSSYILSIALISKDSSLTTESK